MVEPHTDLPVSGTRHGGNDWTIQSLLRDLAARGERPALVWLRGGSAASLAGADLADQTRRLAAGLVRDGLAVGAFAAIVAPNGPEWVIARFALAAVGAVAVALDDLSSESEIAAALADTGFDWVFAGAHHAPVLRRLGGERLNIVLLGADDEDVKIVAGARHWQTLMAEPERELPAVSSGAPAMLVYTSGTTGTPKGFVLDYDHIWANVGALARESLVSSDDRVLVPLPLHHVYPFVVGILTTLQSGATVALADPANRAEFLDALRVLRVTVVVGVPRLYAAIIAGFDARIEAAGALTGVLLRAALHTAVVLRRRLGLNVGAVLFHGLRARLGGDLRLLVSGGARLEDDVLWRLVGLGLDVRSGYGLAETASIFTGNLPGRERLGSEGRPFRGGEIRIAGPDNDGIGEIQLRGPNVFAGYRDNPQANADAFTTAGWFRSGDLGRLDADGYLYVFGRTKELLVLGGGKKVHPEVLEKVYGASPCIREIAVIEHAGALAALVLPDFDEIRGRGYRVEDAVRVALVEISQRLPPYQRLSGYTLVTEPLPRTRLGKFRRFLLPAIYQRARTGTARPPREPRPEDWTLVDSPLGRRVTNLLRERYAGVAITPDANLQLDVGIDSLEWIGLLLAIEQRTGVRLSERDIASAETVRDVLQIVAGAASAAPPSVAPSHPDNERRWIGPTGPVLHAVAIAVYWLNRLLMRALFRVTATGLENLPAGPCVVVANHASDLDPLLIAAVLPLSRMRRTYWGGDAARLFTRPWLAALWRALHVMPVDERLPASSLVLPAAVLARGDSLIWFPEAWRSPDGTVQQFLPGIGKLLADSGMPAVPAFVAGSYEALPRDRRIPRLHRVRIRFGVPTVAAMLAARGEGPPGHAHIARMLRREVLGLSESAASGASNSQ